MSGKQDIVCLAGGLGLTRMVEILHLLSDSNSGDMIAKFESKQEPEPAFIPIRDEVPAFLPPPIVHHPRITPHKRHRSMATLVRDRNERKFVKNRKNKNKAARAARRRNRRRG